MAPTLTSRSRENKSYLRHALRRCYNKATMKAWAATQKGFTLVELAVVILVIGILVAITVVSYNGSQGRARDAARQTAIKEIRSALESYRAETGNYPNEATSGAWEYSYTSPTTFLDDLQPYMGVVPVDPVNDTSNFIYYHRYEAGTSGWGVTCPAARGAYYVLGVFGLDTVSGTDISSTWNCENGATVPTNTSWVPTAPRAVWGAFTF